MMHQHHPLCGDSSGTILVCIQDLLKIKLLLNHGKDMSEECWCCYQEKQDVRLVTFWAGDPEEPHTIYACRICCVDGVDHE